MMGGSVLEESLLEAAKKLRLNTLNKQSHRSSSDESTHRVEWFIQGPMFIGTAQPIGVITLAIFCKEESEDISVYSNCS